MPSPQHIIHPIPPLFDARSRVLILGSFPSVKSREAMFFYGHPQNRFWPLMARLFGEPMPQTIEEKKLLALRRHVALWDSIHSCTITGSSDSSVRDVVPNDLSVILDNSSVARIFCNGALSHQMYTKYIYPLIGIEAVKLPSTSPANAAYSLDRLARAWSAVTDFLQEEV
jgi:hypoxanthine-DNA glycosylase